MWHHQRDRRGVSSQPTTRQTVPGRRSLCNRMLVTLFHLNRSLTCELNCGQAFLFLHSAPCPLEGTISHTRHHRGMETRLDHLTNTFGSTSHLAIVIASPRTRISLISIQSGAFLPQTQRFGQSTQEENRRKQELQRDYVGSYCEYMRDTPQNSFAFFLLPVDRSISEFWDPPLLP